MAEAKEKGTMLKVTHWRSKRVEGLLSPADGGETVREGYKKGMLALRWFC